MDENVFLSIAGFNILLKFHPSQNSFFRNLVVREIKNNLKGFITGFPVTKKDFVIEFYDRPIVIMERKTKNIKRNLIYSFAESRNYKITVFYYISLHQFIFTLTKSLHRLLTENHGFFIHASANSVDGSGVIFTGNSGAGKSTVMSFLNRKFQALADDTVIIRKIKKNYVCFQTPLIEKNSWVKKTGRGYPLDRLYFLRKSAYFKSAKITDKDWLISRLSGQLWTEKDLLGVQMDNLLEFVKNFDGFYLLHFAKNRNNLLKFLCGKDEKI